jgi:hypothetical protein
VSIFRCLALLPMLVSVTLPAQGYAVLTHEAIVDSAWDRSIKPLLLKHYPQATVEELEQAHAYAYGGCIIQDMGYYPFGSKFFSDLVHYVRTGDFVQNLLADAQNLNEYAFAVGALSHYAADNDGHPIAVNRAVGIQYPKLRARFGDVVTYADNPQAHLKTEFGFDVVEVAQGNFATKRYHDFIGFAVPQELLERAFQDTYSLELKSQFASLDLALGTYRRIVSTIIPEATKVAWSLKKDEIVKARPGITKRQFLYNIQRSSYEQEWGRTYSRPSPFARFLAFLFRIVPKVGPFKSLSITPPTQQTEAMFMESFNKTEARYQTLLQQLYAGELQLPNMDFDTGAPTHPGEYSLADYTYGKLVCDLTGHNSTPVSPALASNISAFYNEPPPAGGPGAKGKGADKPPACDIQAALEKIRSNQASAPQQPARSGILTPQ